MILPDDVFKYICSFMRKCECCRKYNESKNLKTCCICKRSWCNKCCQECNYLTYAYFETYVLTCKYCLADLRIPSNRLTSRKNERL